MINCFKKWLVHSRLLKNAIYYVRSAGKGEISIWSETKNGENILNIKDTGTGMSNNKLEKIFDEFYTDRRHGTGLGLAYCKKTMIGFGGDIKCDAKEGEYSHFILNFPKLDAEA